MLHGILLAAGHASRFGSNKLLQRLEDGQVVAVAAALALQRQVDDLLVVLKPEDSELQALFKDLQIPTLLCAQARLGIGHSIACGVQSSPSADAWVIALADMPFIHTDTIATLTNMLRVGAPISAPIYQGRRGHPVGFHKRYRSELLTLQGDSGARSIMLRHSDAFLGFVTQDPGIHRDIDFPADIVIH